jgi:tellurite resistance protein TerC
MQARRARRACAPGEAMSAAGPVEWTVFSIAVAAMLVADLVLGRGRTPSLRNAALWSGIWIGLGLAFGGWVALRLGGDAAASYLTAYLLEKSLSVDNLFIFVLVFSQTGIPPDLQRRALFWGIAGALIMRGVLIGLGVYFLAKFHWLIYPFAALLVYAAVRMLRGGEKRQQFAEASCAICTSWVARFIPIAPVLDGSRFLVRKDGRLMATPLLVALVVIETTDLLFALDSIPAVFAVTRDPFLVYTSNIFALLGLRSLYFLLAGVIERVRFLRVGLAVMLLFTAAKMLLSEVIEIPADVSLAVIAGILLLTIAASRLFSGKTMATCTHLDQIRDVQPRTQGCEECLKTGDRWVQLRLCLSCGHVGCCDSSKNKHATAHFHASGHPIIRTLQPGDSWKWCYVDKLMVE